MSETEKELQRLKNRLEELADRSFRQNLFVFTGFMSLAEQDVFVRTFGSGRTDCCLYGGTEHAQRRMARFGDPGQLGYEEAFPIACIRVEPLQEKFAEELTHRDFLGAILNLGIDRSAVGDLFLEGKSAYVFCTDTMAPYLAENLTQVRHTKVRCNTVTDPGEMPCPRLLRETRNVASLRCDAVLAAVWNLSRAQSQALFAQKKVFVSGKLQENNSCFLKPEDVVSARGYGKFIFKGESRATKKGRPVIEIDRFA